MHQLDRMEEMLQRLLAAHPDVDSSRVHKKDMESWVVGREMHENLLRQSLSLP